jgi:16S rRNA (adenine1518-N6/adenine1519-N6)-dimethyltransferase
MNKFKFQNQKNNVRKPVFAKKSFGQNFLVDQNYIAKIIAALHLKAGETVIEIGAGRGALTEILVESGANVIAIELERNMISVLQSRFAGQENFKLVESDALKIDYSSFILPTSSLKLKLVANLPYNISTAILQKLIEQKDCFSEMVLMFQREVVERITARVGNSERGFLTILTEAYLDAEKLFDVSPRAFSPAPKVWSAVVRLKPKSGVEIENAKMFRQVVSQGFRQKRKTITNNLKSEFENIETVLDFCGIEKQRRAETLTLDEWKCLAKQKAGGDT